MNILIVLTHPDPSSFSSTLATGLAKELTAGHSVEIANLVEEGFSPVFNEDDLIAYRTAGLPPADVRHEQERLDRADAIVFVQPIYWWGLPGLLKGWMDRVFSNGWAYGSGRPDRLKGDALVGKKIHMVSLGASGEEKYERHGYRAAMHTSINHGIFEYCRAPVSSTTVVYDAESEATRKRLPEIISTTADIVVQSLA